MTDEEKGDLRNFEEATIQLTFGHRPQQPQRETGDLLSTPQKHLITLIVLKIPPQIALCRCCFALFLRSLLRKKESQVM